VLREVEDQIVHIGTSGVGRCLELTNLGTDLRADLLRCENFEVSKFSLWSRAHGLTVTFI